MTLSSLSTSNNLLLVLTSFICSRVQQRGLQGEGQKYEQKICRDEKSPDGQRERGGKYMREFYHSRFPRPRFTSSHSSILSFYTIYLHNKA